MARRRPPRAARPRRELLYPTLDLHGSTGEEARRRARAWLAEQRAAGERTVRIVTGRGRHSSGPPVLLPEIEHLLRSLSASLTSEYRTEAGGGAFLVELRRPPPVARPPRPAPPPGEDAGLRRRAEESLAELGISPAPELVALEMRRLAGER